MQAVAVAPQATFARATRARQSVRVMATARPQAPAQKAAPIAAAALAMAAVLLVNVAPASAATVKEVVCASNPTSKICLKDSAKEQ